MSETGTAAPSRFPWPPVLFVVAFLASIVLAVFVPLPWIGPPLSDLLFAAGWLVAAAAVAIFVMAIRTMRAAQTTVMPTKAADHLVTAGPFSFSRNPIYLADAMLMFAVGFIAGSLWFILLGIVAAIATQKLAIEPEEKHLALRFGKKYRDYQKKVRRWF